MDWSSWSPPSVPLLYLKRSCVLKRKRARMKKLFHSKLQNRTTFEGAKRIWTCWEKETPRLDSTLLTKPFHRLPLLCNLNSYSVVLHRKLVLEQLQAEKAPPCLWTASVSSTARYRGWRALQNAVWKTLPSMRPLEAEQGPVSRKTR